MVEAVVRRVWRETPKLTGVVLEVDEDVAKQYTRPGQIVVLRPNDNDKVYLAIASSPGESAALELLMGSAAEEKLKPAHGRALILDPPAGKGFPVEMAEGKDVLLFAVGSALAPMRPLVNLLRTKRSDYGRVVLYAGARSADDFPYQKEFDAWKRDRIDVVCSVSKPWVQDMFKADPVPVEDAVAYVCGMKEMMDAVTATLVEAGMPAAKNRTQLVKEQVDIIRHGAALIARPDVHTLELTGADRVRFLNNMVSNDVAKLSTGRGIMAVKASNKGRVEGLLRVRMSEGALLIDVREVVAATILEVLEKFIIMDDCAIRDVTQERTVVGLYGPESKKVLSAAGLDPGALDPLSFATKGDHTVVRDTWLGVDGYEIHGPDAGERLLAGGAKPVTSEAIDAVRIEAGVPLDGVDVNHDTIPMEARLEHAIDFAKGCYVGQETISRATNFGQVRHILVGFDIGGERPPPRGAKVLSDGKETGEITSAVMSPTLGRPIGIGYVRKADDLIGNWVTIQHDGQTWEATVAGLPFVPASS